MGNLRSIAGHLAARFVLVVAAVALFGLLSMHGWGTHAGMHPEVGHAPTHVASLNDNAHVREAGATQRTHTAAETTSQGRISATACDDDCGGSDLDVGIGLLGLCLAVLGGLMLALALLLLRRCIPLLRTMRPAYRYPALLSRDRDPPDLLRLCVIRC